MKAYQIATVLFLAIASRVCGDSPKPGYLYVSTPREAPVFFVMAPPDYTAPIDVREHNPKLEGFGVAYRVLPDGSVRALWTIEGWYSFTVFLSSDGKYLVAMGPWNLGDGPKEGDLAVAFYREGALLKRYWTNQLVEDRSRVTRTASHYRWLKGDSFEGCGGGLHLDWDNKFYLTTIDGIAYTFDVTTGEISEKAPNQATLPTTTAVTPAASHPSRQP
jgi:hypothetical protein